MSTPSPCSHLTLHSLSLTLQLCKGKLEAAYDAATSMAHVLGCSSVGVSVLCAGEHLRSTM